MVIPDNNIGDVNLVNNWGNTIIIQHQDGLYSKLSHLKEKTITVKRGEKVKQGQINSKMWKLRAVACTAPSFSDCRQMPFIGSKTIEYPVEPLCPETEKQVLNFTHPMMFRPLDDKGH
jgi:hypothetical protein